MNKNFSMHDESPDNIIKRGYYAKLGIERSQTGTSSSIPASKTNKPSAFFPKKQAITKANSFKNEKGIKSGSTKDLLSDKLSLGTSNSNNENSFEEALKHEENKIEEVDESFEQKDGKNYFK